MRKITKRLLAMLLTSAMVITSVPATAFAAAGDGSEQTTAESAEMQEESATEPTVETDVTQEESVAEDPVTEESVEEEPTEEENSKEPTEEAEEEIEIEAETFEEEIMPLAAGTKPADGTTQGQPFAKGTGESKNFRIPAMVTLSDGTIVAATDARWDTTADGGGLDTIVARSTDGGENWNYTFANYLGDNGNKANTASTAFIDPALATDGKNIYMVVDLFPAGYALNGADKQPVAGQNGFTDDGYLKLKKSGKNSYNYYLKSEKIYDSKGKEVSGYRVDEYFNITGPKGETNLFFADSDYQVYPTNYLYLTKSTDGGATWSAPTLINVKKTNEQTCLVGPGNGLVTSTGRIMFTCYNYTNGDKNSSVIYSDDGGATWTRSADMSTLSSEATVAEADGKLYLFARHGGYYVSADNGATWSSKKNVNGISYDTGCQINAITYSEKIDGRTAILLSAPASSRTNGRIFVGLIQDDGSLRWDYTYAVNKSSYAYSCMSELSDGSIGLLYENGSGSEQFKTIAIDTIVPGAEIGEVEEEPGFTKVTGEYITELSLKKGSAAEVVKFKGLTAGQTIGAVSDNTEVAEVSVAGDTLTITPNNAGNAKISVTVQSAARAAEAGATFYLPVTVADSEYEQIPEDLVGSGLVAKKGQGNGKVITKLTTNVGMTFATALKDNLVNRQMVEWISGDPGVATVDQNGTIKGIAVGETKVTAIVKDAEGKVVAVNQIDVTVLQGNRSDGTKKDKVLDFYVEGIGGHTTVYYSLNCSPEMVEVQEGEAIYLSFDESANVAMDFFGAPDEGYALTYMAAPGSNGDYKALQDKTNPKNTDFYKTGAAINQTGPFGDQTVCNMIQAAMNKGCDGAQGFTRPKSNETDCPFTLTFRSEKLPEITKDVVAIRHADQQSDKYQEGMTAVVGDEVFFKVVVHKEAYKDRIDYTNIRFTDEVAGMVLYNEDGTYYDKSTNHSNRTVNFGTAFNTTDEVTRTYYVGYMVKEQDLDSTILNTAKLEHTYSSQYSAGSFKGSANADAKITATSFNPKDIVVDFGLPVSVDFADLGGNNKHLVKEKATATYGTVTVNDDLKSVIYTPDTVLLEADTVNLTVFNTNKEQEFEVSFRVYPATSVYYEEGFASYTGSWSGATMGTGVQATHEVKSKALYGYDGVYSATNGNSGNSVSESSTVGDTAEFTFNGTGADIYALTTRDSGAMTMWLYDEDNKLLKLGYVDTSNTWLEDAEDQDGNYYNTPVFSYKDLTAGEYKVVMKVQSGKISLDGFRVYNTRGKDAYNNVYAQDNENNAQTVEVRDVTIAGSTYDLADIDDWYKYGNNIIRAVYDATNNGLGAIILEEGSEITADADMINDGPKNEIYLKPNQTIAMKIDGQASKVAIGMRSLNGGTISYKINNQAESSMTSTVDMYYDMKSQLNNGILVIQNTGTNVIALTKLKATQFKGKEAELAASIVSDADTVAYALKCIAGVNDDGKPEDGLYEDVPETPGWRYDAIKYVTDHGIMNGISGTNNFDPDGMLTREMFATIIYRVEGSPAVTSGVPFPDVKDPNYYVKPIAWASANGIITGHSNTGLFGVLENITREDMVVIMYRYARAKGFGMGTDADLQKFPDVKEISGYAVEAMQWAVGNGIITGRSNTGKLDPKGNASRVEAAAVIQRFMTKMK